MRYIAGLSLHYAAMVTGLAVYVHFAGRAGLDVKAACLAGLAAIAGACLGGWLLAVILIGFDAVGMVSWGAYGGAVLAAVIILALTKERRRTLSHLDKSAVGFAAAVIVARIGCFIEGCCYGKISWEPWAMSFAPGTEVFEAQVSSGLISRTALQSLPVLPVQLLLVGVGFSCLASMACMRLVPAQRRAPGLDIGICAAVYCTLRALVEPLRGDGLTSDAMTTPGTAFSYVGIAVGLSVIAIGLIGTRTHEN